VLAVAPTIFVSSPAAAISPFLGGLAAQNDLITDQDTNELSAACAGKGVKKLTFGVKASADDRRLGTADLWIH
jgi:hypothetical protein